MQPEVVSMVEEEEEEEGERNSARLGRGLI